MPRDQFNASIGFQPQTAPEATPMQLGIRGQEAPLRVVPGDKPLNISGQDVADIALQGAGTLAGAPAGPGGMVMGSLAGKALSRLLGGGERPDALEATLDVAAPVAGPALHAAGKAVKGAAKTLIGGSTQNIKRIRDADIAADVAAESAERTKGAMETTREAFREKQTIHRGLRGTSGAEAAAEAAQDAAGDALRAAIDATKASRTSKVAQDRLQRAYDAAVRRAASNAGISPGSVNLLSVAGGLLAEPATGLTMLIGGHIARKTHAATASYLLDKPWFVEWALRNQRQPAREMANSLATLAASKELKAEDRTAVRDLQDALGGAPEREGPAPSRLEDRLRRDRRADNGERDTRGRFIRRNVERHPYPWPETL
jgi:hypothetical protein